MHIQDGYTSAPEKFTHKKIKNPRLQTSTHGQNRYTYSESTNNNNNNNNNVTIDSEIININRLLLNFSQPPEEEQFIPTKYDSSYQEVVSPRHCKSPRKLMNKLFKSSPGKSDQNELDDPKINDPCTNIKLVRQNSSKKTPQKGNLEKPLSLEDLSSAMFNMKSYQKTPYTDPSKAKKFNKKFLNLLEKEMKAGKLLEIHESTINDIVRNLVNCKVDTFCNSINDLNRIEQRDLEWCSLELAHQIHKSLLKENVLKKLTDKCLLSLKLMISNALQKHKHYKTPLVDKLIYSLEDVLSGKITLDNINQSVSDETVGSLFLQVIHPDNEEAIKTINQQSYWLSSKSLIKLKEMASNRIQFHLKHLNAQKTVLYFEEDHQLIMEKVQSVDLSQIARTYLMGPELNLDQLTVNGKQINPVLYKQKADECQQEFFFILLKELFNKGYAKRKDDEFVQKQVSRFLQKKPFVGSKILYPCSISAWATCHDNMTSIYPLLFKDPFKTRLQQGTECHMKVSGKQDFSVKVVKTYCTFPLVNTRNDKNSWTIDESRPLCAVQVNWDIHYDSVKGWSHSISTPKIERKKARDEEWESILDTLLTPFPKDNLSFADPINQELLDALSSIQ